MRGKQYCISPKIDCPWRGSAHPTLKKASLRQRFAIIVPCSLLTIVHQQSNPGKLAHRHATDEHAFHNSWEPVSIRCKLPGLHKLSAEHELSHTAGYTSAGHATGRIPLPSQSHTRQNIRTPAENMYRTHCNSRTKVCACFQGNAKVALHYFYHNSGAYFFLKPTELHAYIGDSTYFFKVDFFLKIQERRWIFPAAEPATGKQTGSGIVITFFVTIMSSPHDSTKKEQSLPVPHHASACHQSHPSTSTH